MLVDRTRFGFSRRSKSSRRTSADRKGLAFCYWNWATIAEDLGQRDVALDRLSQAVALLTELEMVEARDAVQRFLDGLTT